MVPSWKSNNEGSFPLGRLANRNAMCDKSSRIEHCYELLHKIRLAMKQEGHMSLHGALEISRLLRRRCIPHLWSPLMQIVDGWEMVVLTMPAETREDHPTVNPRNCNSLDSLWKLSEGRVVQNGDPVQVPPPSSFAQSPLAFLRKPATILGGVYVVTVLHHYLWSACSDNLPVSFFQSRDLSVPLHLGDSALRGSLGWYRQPEIFQVCALKNAAHGLVLGESVVLSFIKSLGLLELVNVLQASGKRVFLGVNAKSWRPRLGGNHLNNPPSFANRVKLADIVDRVGKFPFCRVENRCLRHIREIRLHL
mmetsp:Transcript_12611/g.20058  ORF Transcript_12611/g.20058 Transcript_12611/m.20058 type:complete len:307 (-) Transcript_12611:691-1611(-)